MRFQWDSLANIRTLPRVTCGRLVLALARWILDHGELHSLLEHKTPALQFAATQELRERRGLPRWVCLEQGDWKLAVDLDNPLSVDAFISLLPSLREARLFEMYPTHDHLCVSSSEGLFTHELTIPFVKTTPLARSSVAPQRFDLQMAMNNHLAVRRVPPGGEWLYVKLYGSEAVLEEILTTVVPEVVQEAFRRHLISRWFFIRFADPENHLRIRFNGKPDALIGEVFPLLSFHFETLLAEKRVWRIELV
jgi:hypothetical protein